MSSGSVPTASTLSDSDKELLVHFGRDITQDAIGVIWETVFLSAYGIFFGVAVYTIFRKGLRSRASIAMLCVVVYLYATSLTLWALNVTWWFKSAHALLMDYPDMPLADRVGQANLNTATLGTPMEALFMFNMLIGDSVVIWRAWVLYQRTLWAIFVPCLMLTMSFIFTVIDITCLTGAGWSGQTAIAGGGGVCNHAELISWVFSLVTNASCTVLIGYKAWIHRKEMSSLNMTGNSRRTSTEKIMSLLVESGFIYCFFWLTQLILFFDVSREKPVVYVYELFSGMGDQISGMYPTLIIVIVNLHQTIWEQSSIDITQGSVQWAGPSKRSEHTASTFTSQRRGIKTLQLGSDVENAGGIDTDVVRSKHIPLTEV